jgi:hypothetical protein
VLLTVIALPPTGVAQTAPEAARRRTTAAAANAASANRAASIAKLAAMKAQNRKKLEERMRTIHVKPPLQDYTIRDRKWVTEMVANVNANKAEWKRIADLNRAAAARWQADCRAVFRSPEDLSVVGDIGHLDVKTIKIDQVNGSKSFLNLAYEWWVEGIDTSVESNGESVETERYSFEVVGQKEYTNALGSLRTALLVRATVTSPPTLPPKPVAIPYPGLALDEASEIRMFTVNENEVAATYLRRLRVKSRRYDVFIVSLAADGSDVQLRWIPFKYLSKPDTIWMAKEDRSRSAKKKLRS